MARSACATCHLRKVRCDAHIRGFPCSNCVSSRRSDCQIHQKKKRAIPHSVNNPVPICRRTSITPPLSNERSQSLQPLQSVGNALGSPQIQLINGAGPSGPGRDPELLRDDNAYGQRAIHKGVRITYVGKDVSNISFLVRQRLEGQNERVYHFPSDEIAKKYMRHESDRVPQEAFMLPDKALADELVTAYFTHVNPGCPILNEDIFMTQYAGLDPADPPSLLVLQAVLLVGAHVSKERPERDVLKSMFFRRAKMLFEARVEWNRDYMVQAALLLTWHSDGVEDVTANAWYWVGMAARIATGLGMHRDTTSSSLTPNDKHRWRRTWWILFQHDVAVSLFYGRPQAINLDECDVPQLNALDLEGCSSQTQTEFVLKYNELCILISSILRGRFNLRATSEQRKAALANADEALANWCFLLPPSLHLRSSGTSFWASVLHLTYSNFLILLHRPNPRASQRLDESGPNDADICIAAANAITSIFEDLRKKDQIRYIWLAGVNALFTGMIQISVELRFSNPVLAIHARRRFESTLGSLQELAEYWVVAESILRLFEDSSKLQIGVGLGRDSQIESQSRSATDHHGLQETSGGTRNALPRYQAESNLRPRARSDLDVLAAAANAAVESINAGLIEQEQEEVSDWRQLFPFTDSNQEGAMLTEDITLMENEWRDIYWQEPNILGTFGEFFGGWP